MTKHTPSELAIEFEYQKQECLGIMCGEDAPTPEQLRIATETARNVVNKIKQQEK